MIRRIYNIQEVKPVAETLGRAFYAEGKVTDPFDVNYFMQAWENYFKIGIGAMWVFESGGKIQGALGALLFPDHYSGSPIASEAFWFIDSGARGLGGIRLLQTFEDWAVEVKAKKILMAHLQDSMPQKLEKFYLHRGFRHIESIYMKQL
jgi:GNAT superfamily N-acetyltransferase